MANFDAETKTKQLDSQVKGLCFKEEKQDDIREILKHYKKQTQQENTDSLLLILKFYWGQSEELFNKSIQNFTLEEVQNFGDIEGFEEGNDFLVKNFNLDVKKRNDSLKQVLKSQWDSFKTILETSKTNQKLQAFLVEIIEKALEFAEKYNRRNELKKFVEYIKKILRDLSKEPEKQQSFKNYTDINNKENIQSFIQVREKAFQVCKNLGLWQECFKVLEDIQYLFQVSQGKKKFVKKGFLSKYYENLSEVFWKSQCYLYHAFFYYQHLDLILKYKKENNEIQQLTDKSILAILSIPVESQDSKFNFEKEKKCAQMIIEGTKHINSKEELIELIRSQNIIGYASKPVQKLFAIMCNNLNIFFLNQQDQQDLQDLKQLPHGEMYINLIEENLIYLVMQASSKIYKTLKIENLKKHIKFLSKEKADCIIKMLTQGVEIINCKIDLEKQILVFTQKKQFDLVDASNRLISFTRGIKFIVEQIQTEKRKVDQKLVGEIDEYMKAGKETINTRLMLIQDYKQEALKMSNKQAIAQQLLEQQQKLQKDEQQARLIAKQRFQIEQQKQKQLAEAKIKHDKRLEILKSLKATNQVIRINGKKIELMNQDDMQQANVEDFEKAKNHLQNLLKDDIEKKTKSLQQKCDYIEREKIILAKSILEGLSKGNEEEMLANRELSKKKFDQQYLLKSQVVMLQQSRNNFISFIDLGRTAKFNEDIKVFQEECKQYKGQIVEEAKKLFEEFKKEEEKENEKLQIIKKQQEKQRDFDISKGKIDLGGFRSAQQPVQESGDQQKDTKPQQKLHNPRDNQPQVNQNDKKPIKDDKKTTLVKGGGQQENQSNTGSKLSIGAFRNTSDNQQQQQQPPQQQQQQQQQKQKPQTQTKEQPKLQRGGGQNK